MKHRRSSTDLTVRELLWELNKVPDPDTRVILKDYRFEEGYLPIAADYLPNRHDTDEQVVYISFVGD